MVWCNSKRKGNLVELPGGFFFSFLFYFIFFLKKSEVGFVYLR